MGGGSSKAATAPIVEDVESDESRRAAAAFALGERRDRFEDVQLVDPKPPRDEESLEVVLRQLQDSVRHSDEAVKKAQIASTQANIMAQQLSQKLCPRISQSLQDAQNSPDGDESNELAAKVKHFATDRHNCENLRIKADFLAAQQRRNVAMLVIANRKQRLGVNATTQALLNPAVGLGPRQFHAFMDDGHPPKVMDHERECHMECGKMKSHIAWPFDNDPEQQEREGTDAGAEPADPAVGRLPILDPRLQVQVKQLLGRSFL